MALTTIKDDALPSIPRAKIANDAINSEHYAAGSIDTEHIDDLQVTTAKIANSAVTSAKIADGTLDTATLADGAVTEPKIADDAIADGKAQLKNAAINAAVKPPTENIAAVAAAPRPNPSRSARNSTGALFLIPPSTARFVNARENIAQP